MIPSAFPQRKWSRDREGLVMYTGDCTLGTVPFRVINYFIQNCNDGIFAETRILTFQRGEEGKKKALGWGEEREHALGSNPISIYCRLRH